LFYASEVVPILVRMSLLNEDDIRLRMKRAPSEIFTSESWKEQQLRAAGYDLRIDCEVRGLNDVKFPKGHNHGEELELNPGDSASVLSFERFVMPWDVAANLGLRFRYAREGLSIVTGLLVDPGYGWLEREGELRPIGAPLHFFLTNIGAKPIAIRLGEAGDGVLSLQFLEVQPPKERKEVTPPRDAAATQALWAFKNIEAIKAAAAEERARSDRRISDLQAELATLRTELTATRSATEQVGVFGVFLLGITLLGVATAVIVESLGRHPDMVRWVNDIHFDGTSAVIATALGLVLLVCLFYGTLLLFTKGFAWAIERKRLLRELAIANEAVAGGG
jgi:deoxycytidine triphosphate deaminase